jgi:hypothetical protein
VTFVRARSNDATFKDRRRKAVGKSDAYGEPDKPPLEVVALYMNPPGNAVVLCVDLPPGMTPPNSADACAALHQVQNTW